MVSQGLSASTQRIKKNINFMRYTQNIRFSLNLQNGNPFSKFRDKFVNNIYGYLLSYWCLLKCIQPSKHRKIYIFKIFKNQYYFQKYGFFLKFQNAGPRSKKVGNFSNFGRSPNFTSGIDRHIVLHSSNYFCKSGTP